MSGRSTREYGTSISPSLQFRDISSLLVGGGTRGHVSAGSQVVTLTKNKIGWGLELSFGAKTSFGSELAMLY